MALDRFIHFPSAAHVPTPEEVGDELKSYLQGVGRVEWGHAGARWFATMPGPPEHTLDNERWFEVYIGSDNLDVITRQSDNFTNAVAAGFAERCARVFGGRLEMER